MFLAAVMATQFYSVSSNEGASARSVYPTEYRDPRATQELRKVAQELGMVPVRVYQSLPDGLINCRLFPRYRPREIPQHPNALLYLQKSCRILNIHMPRFMSPYLTDDSPQNFAKSTAKFNGVGQPIPEGVDMLALTILEKLLSFEEATFPPFDYLDLNALLKLPTRERKSAGVTTDGFTGDTTKRSHMLASSYHLNYVFRLCKEAYDKGLPVLPVLEELLGVRPTAIRPKIEVKEGGKPEEGYEEDQKGEDFKSNKDSLRFFFIQSGTCGQISQTLFRLLMRSVMGRTPFSVGMKMLGGMGKMKNHLRLEDKGRVFFWDDVKGRDRHIHKQRQVFLHLWARDKIVTGDKFVRELIDSLMEYLCKHSVLLLSELGDFYTLVQNVLASGSTITSLFQSLNMALDNIVMFILTATGNGIPLQNVVDALFNGGHTFINGNDESLRSSTMEIHYKWLCNQEVPNYDIDLTFQDRDWKTGDPQPPRPPRYDEFMNYRYNTFLKDKGASFSGLVYTGKDHEFSVPIEMRPMLYQSHFTMAPHPKTGKKYFVPICSFENCMKKY